MILDSKIPEGPLAEKWDKHKFNVKLVNPANKRKYDVIVVGTGLAGASAAATLAELGYNVLSFCFQDSARRAHSIAAQGGINAAKNYQNDGDSVHRLFYDTVKGGDFRARESNVHRLAEVSVDIIDQCAAMGVPFARENGRAVGIVVRDLVTGAISSHAAHAVVLATGGYGNAFYLSTNAKGCNVTATYRAYKRGAGFANPCFTQIHPTCIPVSGDHQSKLTLMSESLRNDGRVWVPKRKEDVGKAPGDVAEADRDYYLERKY